MLLHAVFIEWDSHFPGEQEPTIRLPFELDPQIIHHIIYSQAGSIGKAVIELLMNAVDAQASDVLLTLTRDGFECRDNGNGFASREDVLRYFGRFGTPHEEGDATYGRFRLGRGQIMAHASTVWRSKAWTMTVDTRSIGYPPHRWMFASCVDIDPVATAMCYLQLSLLQIPAEIITGNSLTVQYSRVMRTPAYYLHDWSARLESNEKSAA